MELVDKDGKPISLEGVDGKVAAALTALAGGIGAHVSTQIRTAQEATNKAVTDLSATLTQQITGISEKLAASPNGKEPAKADPQADAITAAVTAAIKPLQEQLQSVVTERTEERSQQTARSIAEQYVNKHLSNVKDKSVVIARIMAAKPTKEEEAKAAADQFLAEAKALGVDIDKLTSSPANEGGKEGEANEQDAKKQALLDKVKSSTKQAAA